VRVRPLSLAEDVAYARRMRDAQAARLARRKGLPVPAPVPVPVPDPARRDDGGAALKRKGRAGERYAMTVGAATKRVHVRFDDDDDDRSNNSSIKAGGGGEERSGGPVRASAEGSESDGSA
jgi:hypothetical protein